MTTSNTSDALTKYSKKALSEQLLSSPSLQLLD